MNWSTLIAQVILYVLLAYVWYKYGYIKGRELEAKKAKKFIQALLDDLHAEGVIGAKKKRGRPKGSKNKPKA